MKLHFQEFGEGFPLIILHGLFGSLDNWVPMCRRLAAHFHVFAVDLRNHGRSPHADEFNYLAMAEDLREFIESQNLGVANWLGHSMGGKAAMQFALLYPDSTARLVVVDIAAKASPPAHLDLFDAMLALNLADFRERHEIERALTASISESATRQFLLKNVGRDAGGGFRWKMNLPAIHRNYARLLEPIESTCTFPGPTLFIRGDRSNYLTESDLIAARRLFPAAQMTTVPGAGHWVHADQPDRLLEVVVQFLR